MAGLLLDTHALVWWSMNSARLSKPASDAITENPGAVWVSAASIYELDYKSRIGRIPPLPVGAMEVVSAEAFLLLSIDAAAAAKAAAFPAAHADPFDRLIAAQALLHDFTVVTIDPAIGSFGARTLW